MWVAPPGVWAITVLSYEPHSDGHSECVLLWEMPPLKLIHHEYLKATETPSTPETPSTSSKAPKTTGSTPSGSSQ